MNNDIRLGIVFALSAMGFILFLIETFGRPFVGTIIIFALGFFGLVWWMKFRLEYLGRESEIKKNHFQETIKPLSNGMVLYDPTIAQLIHDESLEPLEKPEKTIETGSEPVQQKPVLSAETEDPKKGVGEWSQEEKIKAMSAWGCSRNTICKAVYGSKNGANMDALNRILNG